MHGLYTVLLGDGVITRSAIPQWRGTTLDRGKSRSILADVVRSAIIDDP